jgi:hypothetical protein
MDANRRQFGSTLTDTVAAMVSEVLTDLRQNKYEVSLEAARAYAIQGLEMHVSEAGAVHVDSLYTKFSQTEQTQSLALGGTDSVRKGLVAAKRKSRAKTYGPITGWVMACGDTLFDATVEKLGADTKYVQTDFILNDFSELGLDGFSIAGVDIINYNQCVGATVFLPTAEGRLFPRGPGAFSQVMGPTSNGFSGYFAGQEQKDFGARTDIYTEMSYYIMNWNPAACVLITA